MSLNMKFVSVVDLFKVLKELHWASWMVLIIIQIMIILCAMTTGYWIYTVLKKRQRRREKQAFMDEIFKPPNFQPTLILPTRLLPPPRKSSLPLRRPPSVYSVVTDSSDDLLLPQMIPYRKNFRDYI